ncbi:DUF368 domain-containing protein [Corynebacterium poyangense]|uniref:DUF368 domain-containing protein n=1 Tax=Corynebacterium poyangense TaxID=2684405 RepID=A0A7H0SNL5_9CORY|nr:DUF368 domain-containing protein [Corynebacterium poyangense]MBZ8177173.1 DUF368 domain-containing protein [Corynebacterium poyangense]QNQ90140.1 DUF368 domain-containing protein [Corynebacterium poyangense]
MTEQQTKATPLSFIANIVRGALIGMTELVPGISGGTVALVVGIYERALATGNHLLDVAQAFVKNRSRLPESLRKVDWSLLIGVGIGMLCAVFFFSSVLHAFVSNHPTVARGLFFGMVSVSLFVPLGMMNRRRARSLKRKIIATFLGCAALAFIGTSFTATPQDNPSLIVIFFAAAIAVCALVLPGVSGSLLLLALGLYAPVIGAVAEKNLLVMAVFAGGALCGIVVFIRFLGYVMTHHRTLTLAAMAGLMLGSLRALWPWQNSDGALLFPHTPVLLPLLAVLCGALIVAAVIYAENINQRRHRGSRTVSDTAPQSSPS